MNFKTTFRTLIVCLLFIASRSAFAQDDITKKVDLTNSLSGARLKVKGDTTWKKVEFGVNLTQGSFSSNWTGGGVSSIALGALFNALSEKKTGKHSWRNDFQSQYGIVKNKSQGSRKNLDRIFFDTKYNYELTKEWSLFANFNLLSQFANGYTYSSSTHPDSINFPTKVSGLFAPAYLTEAIGIEYRPAPYFFIDLAPGAVRQTIVSDKNLYLNIPGNYGVKIGKRFHNEVGIVQLVANFDKEVVKDINLKFRYQLFTAYNKNQVTDKREFKNDHRLDAMVTAKIAKYFNVNLGAIVIYNKSQVDDIQFAQGLSIGFLYTF
ncbi:DUF3078 domain-containing protein [Dyadobacter frigoris]|uniref:DUF3078 domain-containing protein n=1 Tax=Dyadobacter frigoris TaxID=2576211 RepID=A0A4U6D393_9BACT|nr:DUF3078 domain-containing protein [Dyadobacter frigoris]TKT91106.1 DUF3078 domain-containing protein [Dyadobacter frigoris]GLU55031.1 hypothetical protein Dfri01_44920 [Dyadobacter frigoris]